MYLGSRDTEWTDNPCLTRVVCGSRNSKKKKKKTKENHENNPDKINTEPPAQLENKNEKEMQHSTEEKNMYFFNRCMLFSSSLLHNHINVANLPFHPLP